MPPQLPELLGRTTNLAVVWQHLDILSPLESKACFILLGANPRDLELLEHHKSGAEANCIKEFTNKCVRKQEITILGESCLLI